MNGAERIVAERLRHTSVLGWTPEHDDEHDAGELAMAAVCYAAPDRVFVREVFAAGEAFVDPWPFGDSADARPRDGNVLVRPTPEQRIRLLAKAGAFIAAEIDRLLRAGAR